ncbi:pilus assembly protein TadG-related protein [Aquisalibacillus elongatus]|uniref:Putative Flp pilus-assembly TadE/G-like protein n=1 Tax=Aquisalibacillus elongatus TaxID=485577 RepID=A0A3N5BK69_9BACI|nr:pilus assembly protein TadG-related protein [Aquisalibacillus elongatus]RPF50078.1 putative Flp pilus-assembly TadE/G-like protein [Aquisalibacillus elongatus]
MKWVNNERGSATFIMFSLLAGMIIMGFIFFDMTSVFMERRISQTGSDAAAIAAAQKAEEVYEDRIEEKIKDSIDHLETRTKDQIEQWEEEFEEMQEDSEPGPSPISWDEFFDEKFEEWIEQIEEEHDHRSMPSGIVSYLRYNIPLDIDIENAMKFFWNEEQLSNLICEAVLDHKDDEIRDAAQHYADLNGIENDISVVFPVEEDEFKVGIRTKSTINDSFVDSVNTDELKVPANAVVNIQKPRDINVVCD